MNPHFLNLVLDTLHGCNWHCSGCYVEDSTAVFDEFEKTMAVIRDCEQSGMTVSTIRLGPTDIFAADNATDVLLDPNFIALLKNPKTDLLFNTALTSPQSRIQPIIDILNHHYLRDYLYFNVVLNPKALKSAGYRKKIEDNIAFIRNQSQCRHIKFVAGINVEPSEEFAQSDLADIYNYAAKVMPDVELELGLNFARQTGFDNDLINRAFDYANQLTLLRKLFLPPKIDCENGFINVLWREGQWYWSPNLYYEFVNSHDPKMKIDFDTFDELLTQFNHLYTQQFLLGDIECNGCEFFKICSLRFVPLYMDVIGRKKCILPKQQMIDDLLYCISNEPNPLTRVSQEANKSHV